MPTMQPIVVPLVIVMNLFHLHYLFGHHLGLGLVFMGSDRRTERAANPRANDGTLASANSGAYRGTRGTTERTPEHCGTVKLAGRNGCCYAKQRHKDKWPDMFHGKHPIM